MAPLLSSVFIATTKTANSTEVAEFAPTTDNVYNVMVFSFGSRSRTRDVYTGPLKPNSITLASSELAPNMFEARSELASVMEFGFYCQKIGTSTSHN